MLMTVIGILIILWIIGLLVNVGGSLIHLLLVAAVVVFLWKLITGRRGV